MALTGALYEIGCAIIDPAAVTFWSLTHPNATISCNVCNKQTLQTMKLKLTRKFDNICTDLKVLCKYMKALMIQSNKITYHNIRSQHYYQDHSKCYLTCHSSSCWSEMHYCHRMIMMIMETALSLGSFKIQFQSSSRWSEMHCCHWVITIIMQSALLSGSFKVKFQSSCCWYEMHY